MNQGGSNLPPLTPDNRQPQTGGYKPPQNQGQPNMVPGFAGGMIDMSGFENLQVPDYLGQSQNQQTQQASGGFQATNAFGSPLSSGTDNNMQNAALGIGAMGLLGGASLKDLGMGYLGYEIGQQGIERAREIPSMMGEASANIANQVGQAAEFRPYTVTSGAGNIGISGSGVDLSSNATQQQLQNQANLMSQQFGQGLPNVQGMDQAAYNTAQQAMGANSGQFASQLGGLYAGLGQNQMENASQANTLAGLQGMFADRAGQQEPTATAESIYNQIRATQTPEEERQRLALEERLQAQGRGGIQTAQYGGTPEQLAQEKALAEARNSASLQSIQAADALRTSQAARQTQAGQLAGNLGQIGGNLTAQQQELGQGLLGLGLKGQELGSNMSTADLARAQTAQQIGSTYSQLPAMLQGQQLGNIAGMLETSGIPLQQQLSVLQQTSPYAQMAQLPAELQARALANLGQETVGQIPNVMNTEAMLRQGQMESIMNSMGLLGGGSGVTGNSTIDNLLNSGATDLLGQGWDWLTGMFSDDVSDGSTGGDLLADIVADYDVNRPATGTVSGDDSLNKMLGIGGGG